MATKTKGLGKGLGALLGDVAVKKEPEKKVVVEEKIELKPEMTLKLRQVEPNRNQPRKDFDEAELAELAESIRIHGVIQPLIVTRKGDHYQIVAGERRWRAAKLAGLKEIPVIVREYSEQTIAEVALIENIQRKDLNPIEEAKAFETLISEYQMTQEVLAERVSKSRTAITNALRLLKLPEKVQKQVQEGALSTGHAKVLLGIPEEKTLCEVADRIIADKLSVRDTERYIKSLGRKPQDTKKKTLRNKVAYDEAEQMLKEKLGTKVVINRKTETTGRIEIDYYSTEDIERILEHIK